MAAIPIQEGSIEHRLAHVMWAKGLLKAENRHDVTRLDLRQKGQVSGAEMEIVRALKITAR
jgi:hypothetical protein